MVGITLVPATLMDSWMYLSIYELDTWIVEYLKWVSIQILYLNSIGYLASQIDPDISPLIEIYQKFGKLVSPHGWRWALGLKNWMRRAFYSSKIYRFDRLSHKTVVLQVWRSGINELLFFV